MRYRILSVFILGFIFTVMTSFLSNYGSKTEVIDSEEGISFNSMTLEEAKSLSAKTGKLIFIDVYTSWCGPCKLMTRNTFTDKAVGSFFNENFINLKLDAEKDEDGIKAARMYKVQAYPTLLFIDGDGKLVRNYIGYRDASQLLNIGNVIKQ
ncbi:MAG: thioredoxin 1 [Lentimonas sp.]|jgi:thioredoxin 1